jgi:hypothetical protein
VTTPIWPEDYGEDEVVGQDPERHEVTTANGELIRVDMVYPLAESTGVKYQPDAALRRIHLRGQPDPLTTRSPEGAALQGAVDRVVRLLASMGWHEGSPAMVSVVRAILDEG